MLEKSIIKQSSSACTSPSVLALERGDCRSNLWSRGSPLKEMAKWIKCNLCDVKKRFLMSRLYLYRILNKFWFKPSTQLLMKNVRFFCKWQANGPLAEKLGDGKSRRNGQKYQRGNIKWVSRQPWDSRQWAEKEQTSSCRPQWRN